MKTSCHSHYCFKKNRFVGLYEGFDAQPESPSEESGRRRKKWSKMTPEQRQARAKETGAQMIEDGQKLAERIDAQIMVKKLDEDMKKEDPDILANVKMNMGPIPHFNTLSDFEESIYWFNSSSSMFDEISTTLTRYGHYKGRLDLANTKCPDDDLVQEVVSRRQPEIESALVILQDAGNKIIDVYNRDLAVAKRKVVERLANAKDQAKMLRATSGALQFERQEGRLPNNPENNKKLRDAYNAMVAAEEAIPRWEEMEKKYAALKPLGGGSGTASA